MFLDGFAAALDEGPFDDALQLPDVPLMTHHRENVAKMQLSRRDFRAGCGIFAQANNFVTALALTSSRGCLRWL